MPLFLSWMGTKGECVISLPDGRDIIYESRAPRSVILTRSKGGGYMPSSLFQKYNVLLEWRRRYDRDRNRFANRRSVHAGTRLANVQKIRVCIIKDSKD